ncbi:MAG TPA: hydantoinase/oxoprolinase family protein [Dehalococcoidia bacterium]|nr:hydantoinase/oxoprolinase family protein [Dehalococcoidia bacterium]
MATQPGDVRIGVDIGGTFTDLVLLAGGGPPATWKLLTTPDEYGRAVIEGLAGLLARLGLAADRLSEVVHGTTVATNAVLERKGARTGLITTEGFRDVLEIRRIRSPELYNLAYEKPEPLVPRRHRLEVPGRIDATGTEVRPLDLAAAERALARLADDGIEAVAVALINSYANPAHEQAIGRLARDRFPHLEVSLSSDVLPEIREYERTSTTVINAYLTPVARTYLQGLADDLRRTGVRAPLLIMQSNGGVMPAAAAQTRPIHIVESGPAAGVIAAGALAGTIGRPNVLTFDMGGTTAKASIIEDGQISQTPEYEVGGGISVSSRLIKGGGYVLRAPVIDIAEVGAGGGSIVWIDRGGSLQIGPRSAGAQPGPVCYGAGATEPTVSDANLALGYLNPEYLAGGALPLDAEAARRALTEQVAKPLGLSIEEAAYGVHLVANANMMRAVRAVSSQRGRDPRGYALFAFGGSGPVHAVELARSLEMPEIVVPVSPGLFSAFGLLCAAVEHHYVRTVFRRTRALDLDELNGVLADLEREAIETLGAESYPPERVGLRRQADLRYAGQSFELTVPLEGGSLDTGAIERLREAFAREHERTYGHRGAPDQPVDLVSLRLVATGLPNRPPAPAEANVRQTAGPAGTARRSSTRPAYFGPAGWLDTPVIDRPDLHGLTQTGPLIIEEYDATTVIPPGCRARLDDWGNIRITIGDVRPTNDNRPAR